MMQLHFIAIGGAIMHQLAISSKKKGHKVTGSDDFIADPAKSNLANHDLLPKNIGWNEENIHEDLDAIILGMHAKEDNPELQKALALNIPIYSFPEYIYNNAKDKQRVVIAGSHGKTTTTSMVMHCLKKAGRHFDYLVGSKVPGFEYSVQLTDAPVMIIEGDEYMASAIERRPKIHFYKPDIATITGIAWDHINVFPTIDIYNEQFEIFLATMEEDKHIIYNAQDKDVVGIMEKAGNHLKKWPYLHADYRLNKETDKIEAEYKENYYPLNIFGEHNLQNLEAARRICNLLDIESEYFYKAMEDFTGAARRLEVIKNEKDLKIFKDFAHAPSKVKAAVKAMKDRYADAHFITVLELHTYSSLNKDFINTYEGSLVDADNAAVFYSADALRIKRMDAMSDDFIKDAFKQKDLSIFDQSSELSTWVQEQINQHEGEICILFMSSGQFDQMSLNFEKQ